MKVRFGWRVSKAIAGMVLLSGMVAPVVAAEPAAIERLAERERQLLAPRPESKEGASALLTFLATVIEPHEEIAELALPAIEGVRSALLL